jgi:phage terminase large subunit-like protein
MITGAVPCGEREVNCIEVDGGLYLAGRSLIATHNSTDAAGTGLYLAFADDEPGAEVYSTATKKDQAIIVHSEATRMVRANQEFQRLGVEIYKNNICRPGKAQKYEPLGADEDTMDGYNVHGAIVDELHAHKTRGAYDLMDTGTSARRQPILWAITTAGTDQTEASVCWEQHVYTEQILRGIVQDDSHFGMIFCLDKADDWTEEKNWYKANPNLGISKKLDYMREQAIKAKALPSKQNTFKRLDLNEWTQQATRWIDMGLWDANAGPVIDEAALIGRPCYGGIDLSSVSDITAWMLVFPDPVIIDRLTVLVRLWCPEARLQKVEVEDVGESKSRRRNLYAEQYQAWEREGYIMATPGNAIDYEQIEAQIAEDAKTFNIQEVAIDRLFQGYQMAMRLQEHHGLTVAACGMGYMSMAGPCAEFERRLLEKKIHHGGHPVLRWMANNVAVREDPAGNKKPDKSTSQGKIDGIVALLLGLDRVMRQQNTASVYEERGVLTL